MKWVGWIHKIGALHDEGTSYPEVVGDEPEPLIEYLSEEYEVDEDDWLGDPRSGRGPGTHVTTSHPEYRAPIRLGVRQVKTVEELRGDVEV